MKNWTYNMASTQLHIRFVGILLLACTLPGCSTRPQWEEEKDIRVHPIASRQLPPEEVYSRLKWVHPPEVLPARKVSTGEGNERILPIINLDLTNSSLEEAAQVLAATTRYRSFVSSSISKKRLTIRQLGTIEELAEEIGKKAQVEVTVDHETRSLRFFERLTPENEPSFADF